MKRVKRAIYSGVVLEQLVYTVPERQKKLKKPPRTRFATEEERAAHREGISRRHHARLVNENFNTESLYSTLTFDNTDEVYDFADAKRLRNNFVRRLQYYCPDAKIIIYMGRGKHTHRIHFHMLSHGIPEKLIQEQWIYGSVIRVEHLRGRCRCMCCAPGGVRRGSRCRRSIVPVSAFPGSRGKACESVFCVCACRGPCR